METTYPIQTRLFNDLCRFGQKKNWLPSYVRSVIRRARPFIFPGRAHELLNVDVLYGPEGRAFLESEFFLPFPIVAVIDTASVILLWDNPLDEKTYREPAGRPLFDIQHPDEIVTGGNVKRGFLELLPIDGSNHAEFGRNIVGPSLSSTLAVAGRTSAVQRSVCSIPNSYCITWGVIEQFRLTGDENRHFIYGGVNGSFAATPERYLCDGGTNYDSQMAGEIAMRNVGVAMEEVATSNLPSKWIVEARKERATAVGEKSARKHVDYVPDFLQRPHYMLVTQDEASTLLGVPQALGSTGREGHERKRHRREFKAPCFTRMQGQSIFVRAAWVGPTEAKRGNDSYRLLVRH